MPPGEDVAFKPTSEYSGDLDTPKQAQVETIQERLLKYGTLINVRGSGATGVGTTIYTVPVGKTFFLISCCIDLQNLIAGTNNMIGKIVIKLSGSSAIGTPFLIQVSGIVQNDFNSDSLSFPIPVKIVFGQELVVYKDQSGATNVVGSIQGYEISNEFLK